MALAAIPYDSGLAGCFVESSYGRMFEYSMNPEMVLQPDLKTGRNTEYPHLVYVGPWGSETRMALVKKTVAYVVVDERADGSFKIEKWNIKHHREYAKKIG